jgi:hypothetical protein
MWPTTTVTTNANAATTASPFQSDNFFTVGTNVSEDCLYLNVFTPAKTTEGPLPVMVFFYGGSWNQGSAMNLLYWGGNLVATAESSGNPIILVTVNYRLNGFGFLGADAMREPDDGSSPYGDEGSSESGIIATRHYRTIPHHSPCPTASASPTPPPPSPYLSQPATGAFSTSDSASGGSMRIFRAFLAIRQE